MKKILIVLLAMVAALCTAFSFTACDLFAQNNSESGDNAGTSQGSDNSGNNISGGNTSGGNTSGGNTSGGNTSGGNTSGGNTSGGNTSGGNTSGGNTSGGNAPHVCNYVFTSTEPADCLTQGYDLYSCTCGKTDKRNYKKALGHDYKDTIHKATCTTDWSMTSVCTRCNDTKTQTVADSKLPHDYAWTVTKNATCTVDGSKSGVCSECGATATQTIKASGHSYGAYTPNNDATCVKAGTESAVCSTCSHVDKKTVVGSKLGHSYGNYKVDYAATCENDGRESAVCATCKDVTTRVIAAKGHNFVNDVCKNCGVASSSLSSGLVIADRGAYCEVTGLGTASGDIVIPATYNGKPVTDIGFVFNGYTNNDVKQKVTGLVIPDSVTKIWADACFGCDNLESLVIGDGVTEIGDNAFGSCPKLKDVTLGSNVEIIGDSAFAGCESLTRIRLPENLKSIDRNAFYGCKNLVAIMYSGTKAQWNAITKDPQWFNGTKPCTVYCNDGNITL